MALQFGARWPGFAICGFARSSIFPAVFFFAVACNQGPYQEKEIRVVLSKAPPGYTKPSSPKKRTATETVTELDTPKPTSVPNEVSLREELKKRLAEIQKMIRVKQLTADDLLMLVPGISMDQLAGEIEKGEVEAVGRKLSELRQSLEWVTIDQGFVSEKLSRTRSILARTPLSDEKVDELRGMQEKVGTLIQEEKFEAANEKLTAMQEEMTRAAPPAAAVTATATPTPEATQEN